MHVYIASYKFNLGISPDAKHMLKLYSNKILQNDSTLTRRYILQLIVYALLECFVNSIAYNAASIYISTSRCTGNHSFGASLKYLVIIISP